ncbi:hypothetical protein M445_12175 [Vibrio owensii 47666-1]|uniref:helix-turn-helix domain-containing protein n=1 Tax=Vibrio owensii TaxID=696485 RepID=UPI000584E6F0|nr:helix-turn-helix transcriptional regulator [Vibrio owensii]KIF47738.1 hypothetical protein M445_12175 [Vibrio owensii 47666-1]
MSSDYFSQTLKGFIEKKRVNRELIIDVFNKSAFEELSKCDLTTLSRWVSGKTIPSLNKQFKVCIALGIDLLDFVMKLDPSLYKEGKKSKDAFDEYTRYLNHSNANLSYFSRSKDVDVYYGFLESADHRRLLDPYLGNFSGYMSLREVVDKNNIIKPYHVFLFKENGNLCGHIAITDDNVDYLKLFDVYSDNLDNSIGILPAYYMDAKIYWLVVSSLLYFYLSTENYKKNTYITMNVRDRNTWEYYKQVASGETLTFFAPSNQLNNLDKGYS